MDALPRAIAMCSSNPMPPGLSKLSVLHNLADWVLHEAFSSATGMQLPEPAVMEGLTRLQLGGRRIQVRGGAAERLHF